MPESKQLPQGRTAMAAHPGAAPGNHWEPMMTAVAEGRPLRAVVFPEGDRWVAQCLEVNLAISAARLDDLPKRVRNQLRAQLALDKRHSRQPFSALEPAPDRFFEMWDESELWQTVHLESRFKEALRALERSRQRIVELAAPRAALEQPG